MVVEVGIDGFSLARGDDTLTLRRDYPGKGKARTGPAEVPDNLGRLKHLLRDLWTGVGLDTQPDNVWQETAPEGY